MSIVILGWGSLIWDPRELPRDGEWHLGGPVLPVEFSRVSKDGRLTLVVDHEFGHPVTTRYIYSPRTLIAEVVADLAKREGTRTGQIGYVDLSGRGSRSEETALHHSIQSWCAERGIAGAVWTALAPNFQHQTGKAFSQDNAVSYLRGLPRSARDIALRYIESAPEEVQTPVRRRVADLACWDWIDPIEMDVVRSFTEAGVLTAV